MILSLKPSQVMVVVLIFSMVLLYQ